MAALVLASTGITPAAAHGAVLSGTQSEWPDAAYDVGAQAFNPSIQGMGVAYDDQVGSVVTSVTLDRSLYSTSPSYFSFNFTLSKPEAGRGCGDSRYLIPAAHVEGSVSVGRYGYSYTSVRFDPRSGYSGSISGSIAARSATQYEFTVHGRQGLTRQGIRCVSAPSAYANEPFEASNFCLGGCPADTGSGGGGGGITGPVAPTQVRATVAGQTVTLNWAPSPDPDFSYFAVRRGTDPKSNLATWTRLAPSFTTSTATDNVARPGTYYYYVTQINKAGKAGARSTVVRVDVAGASAPVQTPVQTPGGQPPTPVVATPPAAAPVTPPATPVQVTQPRTPVAVAPQAPSRAVKTPRSPRGQRTVTAAQARRQAAVALRRAYKRSFTSGTRYRSTCRRISATRQTCRVSWRYKRYLYSGQVVVRLKASGYSNSLDIDRRRR